jgi:hypothetical protein
MDLRNVGILPRHYTASQPRRPRRGTVALLVLLGFINCAEVKNVGVSPLPHTSSWRGASRDSSVSAVRSYGLENRFDSRQGYGFLFRHRIQTYPRDHPASSPMGTADFIPGGKAAGA